MSDAATPVNDIDFTFSDMVMGYVTSYDRATDVVRVTTSDGRPFDLTITANTYAELVRNLGEPYQDATGALRDMLEPGRMLFGYGTFLPVEGGRRFDVKHIVFVGKQAHEYPFERRNWWVHQIDQLAQYYLKAEFGDEIDWRDYRTTLTLEGTKVETTRQETDTVSRLVYGFASAFLLTGNDRYLEAAEKGTKYLRDHMRWHDAGEGISYWYHGIDVDGTRERKILASEFGDDYNAIPAYEQIYALAGPAQTLRATGDQRIVADVHATIEFFDRFFRDREQGGYFSHVDPITFDPRAEELGQDRARKNWNSVGDHAPAYLINACLATDDPRLWAMLETTFDTITERFPDYEHSDFVNEKFFEDWSRDQTWGWQQNRAVVGHNLKIAWNLTRMWNRVPKAEYLELAKEIARRMPGAGMDAQRGGWYDVVERQLEAGERFHAFAWHDRKAWWQQEQGILAYLILAGSVGGDDDYLRLARESSAFYNAWFLDQDSGGIYFNVLANGLPYLLGNERLKGSHSMAGYHSFELCYLAATYTNLLVTKEPLDLYFKPIPGSLPDNVLRVAPDILPANSVKISRVWVDEFPYEDFDAECLVVRLPDLDERVTVRVELVSTVGVEHFECDTTFDGSNATLRLSGVLDTRAVPTLRAELGRIVEERPSTLTIDLEECTEIHPVGVRALVFACQKLPLGESVVLRGCNDLVRESLRSARFEELVSVT